MTKLNKWTSETDAKRIRRYCKLTEELGELTSVVGRCVIQGIDEIDPASKKTNRERLQEEMADVLAQIKCAINDLSLNQKSIDIRVNIKCSQMQEWENLVSGDKILVNFEHDLEDSWYFIRCPDAKFNGRYGQKASIDKIAEDNKWIIVWSDASDMYNPWKSKT